MQAQCSLAALNSIEQKCGLSSEQQEKKNELINVLDTSKKVLGYYDVNKVEMVDGEIISNKTQYYIEKSNDLPLEKKEIFNKHKKYLDNGVYSNIEFECKVAYLFEQ